MHPKKVVVTVWWSAARLKATRAFGILGKPLHLRSMLSTPVRYTENLNTCIRHWSTERAQFFSTVNPDCRLHNQCFKKLNKLVYEVWPHLLYSPTSRQLTTISRISTTFCRENASTASRRQKMLSKCLSNLKAWIFMLQE